MKRRDRAAAMPPGSLRHRHDDESRGRRAAPRNRAITVSLDTAAIMALEVLNSITILVLLALGLAVIFGMMRIVNLAQGEFFTAGAFTVLAGIRYAHLPHRAALGLAPRVARELGIARHPHVRRRVR